MWWFLATIAVYLTGWILAIPGALQRRMRDMACNECGVSKRSSTPANVRSNHNGKIRHLSCSYASWYEPRGAFSERSDGDVAIAMAMALLWLPLLPVRIAGFILKNRYLTAPELERRNKELERQIEKLTRELKG